VRRASLTITFTLSDLPCSLFLEVLRKSVTTIALVAALMTPATNAFAAARSLARSSGPKKITTDMTVDGPVVKCHQWGYMELELKVAKTVTGSKTTLKILGVGWSIYPNHTPRSIYINTQALPLLQGEVLQLQMNAVTQLQNISGASNTTVSWADSLKGAFDTILGLKYGGPMSARGGAPPKDWMSGPATSWTLTTSP
jgi:hypothetical protein